MKHNNRNTIIKNLFPMIMLILIMSVGSNIYGKSTGSGESVSVIITLRDSDGNIIQGAKVFCDSELIGQTDVNGILSFETKGDNPVTIEAPGYKTVVTNKEMLARSSSVQMEEETIIVRPEVIPMPFTELNKKHLTGGSIVIKGEELERYPGSDVRNGFTGLVNGLEIRELYGNPGVSAVENYNTSKIRFLLRGGNPIFIIDGIPVDLTEMALDPSEIESVTIVKDIVEKAMYGPRGAGGIVYIKTKHGKANGKAVTINAEKGISVIDRMPEWVSGQRYAELNNMARENSFLNPLYNTEAIDAYSQGDPYNMFYPSVDFRNMLLKNTKGYNRFNASSSGGNDVIQYFGYLGYTSEGDIYKIGHTSDYNRINARSNIDIKINDFLKVNFGIFGAISLRRSPNYGDNLDFVEFESVLNDINTIPPIAFPVYANNSPELEKPWYAVTSNYGNNPIGNMVGDGFYTEQGRNGAANMTFDFDLSSFLKGLSSKTYVGFNLYNQTRIGKDEAYTAYIATPSQTDAGADTILLTKVHDGFDTDNLTKLDDFYFQKFAVFQSFGYEKKFNNAYMQNSLTYYLFKSIRDGLEESQRLKNIVWSGLFSFKDKYSLSWAINYSGTYSFSKGNRYSLFPSLGAGWVITEGKKSLRFIDYLKLRAEFGILGYDTFYQPFFYRDNFATNSGGASFGPISTNTWFGNNTETGISRTVQSRVGNPALSWEKRKELNIGLDARLFSGKLALDINYYNYLRDGIITSMSASVPAITGLLDAPVRSNFEQIRYHGFEIGTQLKGGTRDFNYSLGVNATINNSKNIKVDEPDYRFDYQKTTGRQADAYFGLRNIGRFQSDEETLLVPQLFDESLHAGDLKYEDMNHDGVVDNNDRSVIGHTSPRLYYAANVSLHYKNIELTVVGTGRAFYDIPLTNSYFWNGWGDNNYSAFVSDNLGGKYPALTYYKVNNNFLASDFWLTKGDFFKLQNIELAYDLNDVIKVETIKTVRLFVRGANLFTISKIKDVDPESVNSGIASYPLFTSFTGGVKLTF